MSDPEQALATQLANIEKRTGKTLAELAALIHASGLSKHGELVAMLKQNLGMGHGDANTLVHTVRKADQPKQGEETGAAEDPLASIYSGAKAHLRAIHEQLLTAMAELGEFETAAKKTYISYRRKKQFTMIGPATNTRVEVGLNIKNLAAHERLNALPAGQMCQFKVKLTTPDEVDEELLNWIRQAYEAAGG